MGNDDKHCSYCVHYEPCADFRMYCKALKRRITAKKKPCKYYELPIDKKNKTE